MTIPPFTSMSITARSVALPPLNASSGAASGAAIALHPDDATADDIHGAVQRVVSQDRLREAAVRVAADIEGMPSADKVAGLLVRRFG